MEELGFEKQGRRGVIVYLYYNRDVRKLEKLGRVLYHSRQHRYVQLYVDESQTEAILHQLENEKYVKEASLCPLKDLQKDFVGCLEKT